MWAGDKSKPPAQKPRSAGPHLQSTGCVVCGLDQNGDSILLCDGCDGEYHTYCLVPPLTEIPAGDFYCKKCTEANLVAQRKAAATGNAQAVGAPGAAGVASAGGASAASSAAATVARAGNDEVKDSKYRGVSKITTKGVKKPFIAKLWVGTKYVQLGVFGSEIEAAHAYDKAALQHYGKNAQLNFPHLHDSFIRPQPGFTVRTGPPSASPSPASAPAPISAPTSAPSPAAAATVPSSSPRHPDASAGRGRGRGGRGRGRGRGRTKRAGSPEPNTGSDIASATASAIKRRKTAEFNGASQPSATPTKKYLGVQVHRVFAHAQIQVNDKLVNLGTFPTAKEAALAYDKAALKFFGGVIGSPDAKHDQVVLNFPEQRAQLLKQIVQDEEQKKLRDAAAAAAPKPSPATTTKTTTGSSYASRSTQNAKYNLSIMKLNTWVTKLQRSIKLVEASQRVEWRPATGKIKDEVELGEESEEAPSLVKTEVFGSGPTIKKEFTKRDQILRESASQIQDAVALLVDELRVYAGNAPVDPFFQPPPRCSAIWDLLSTSRHLKLISSISELANLKILPDDDSQAAADGVFEAKLQSVVDFRARLQMSGANEKQRMATLIRDIAADASPDAADKRPGEAGSVLEVFADAKYVKRKVRVEKPAPLAIVEEVTEDKPAPEADEAHKSSPPPIGEDHVTTDEVNAAQDGDDSARIDISESKSEPADDGAEVKDTPVTEEAPTTSVEDAAVADAPTDAVESIEHKVDESLNPAEEAKSEVEVKQEIIESAVQASEDSTIKEPVEEPETVAEPKEDVDMTESDTKIAEEAVEDRPHEDEWKFELCLAIPVPVPGDDSDVAVSSRVWRLLPLESESGEFVKDVHLTDEEVSAIEMSEGDVCLSSEAVDGRTSWMQHLRQLHSQETVIRQLIQRETNHQHALQGIIKIEQERLEQLSNVYRKAMEGISQKTTVSLKSHARVSQDAAIVELMTGTFDPILRNLLNNCEDALLECFHRLSARFEEFEQEFEYYRTALVSLTAAVGASAVVKAETPPPETNGGKDEVEIKRELIAEGASDPSDVSLAIPNDEKIGELEDSTGLRQAYITFYMEEMETLWKERSSSLEMVQAIQRSLDQNGQTEAGTSNSDTPSAEIKESWGKLGREKELREEITKCLEQWRRIEWPKDFNSTFLTSMDAPSAVKEEELTIATPMEVDEDAVQTSSSSVMAELRRVMIDLTQEQSVHPPKPPQPTTLVVYHPAFIDHQTPQNHPECPERLTRVINILTTLSKTHQEILKVDRLTVSPEELCPPETTLLMVHSPMYLRQLKERSIEAGKSASPKNATKAASKKARSLVFETDSGISDDNSKESSDKHSTNPPLVGAFGASSLEQNGIAMDTYVSGKSWDVARAAAGTVCLAVDRVVRKEYHNAVCLVRPPGHHVGRHGRTETAPSSGFCLLNNVVIGATHARMYPWIRKVAVLDWDIHHGNGTEELLKDDPDAFFASIHLYSAGHYFPGTGKARDDGRLINVALENNGAGSGSLAFREALTTIVLPAMKTFAPDIIFISAGFDGHRDDILGGVAAVKDPNVPAGYVEDDYSWATQQVLQLATEVCDGRVVSVLEGGYDVRRETNALARSVAAHISAIAEFELTLKQTPESEDKTVIVKEGEGGLLAKLLATNLDDDDVVIIDDEDEDGNDGAEVHDKTDDKEEEEEEEEKEDVDGSNAVHTEEEDETGDEDEDAEEEDVDSAGAVESHSNEADEGDVAMEDAENAHEEEEDVSVDAAPGHGSDETPVIPIDSD